MHKKCPNCETEREIVAFRLASETCNNCGHNPQKARLIRWSGIARKIVLAVYPYAITLLYLMLPSVVLWVLLDACFHSALIWARVDLGIPDETGKTLSAFPNASEKYHQWSALGVRIVAMIILAVITPLLAAFAIARPIVDRPRKLPIIALIPLLVGSTVLVHQYDNILWEAAFRRVEATLPRFETVAAQLLADWPTDSGELPEFGEYFAHTKRPGKLYLQRSDSYARTESFGAFVERLPDGGVSFSLAPHYLFVLEYHPAGQNPKPQLHSKYWVDTLQRSKRVAGNWFFTKYSSARTN